MVTDLNVKVAPDSAPLPSMNAATFAARLVPRQHACDTLGVEVFAARYKLESATPYMEQLQQASTGSGGRRVREGPSVNT